MISSRYNFIYLHAPKTGGNSIQAALLSLSDDKPVVRGHQDGVQRFEVEGPVTAHKHADLQSYAGNLGKKLKNYQLALSVRHPLTRAVSFYFSPHRWMRQTADGWKLEAPVWDQAQFERVLAEMRPLISFVTVDGQFRQPDVLIRYEQLEADFQAMLERLGLPHQLRLEHRNPSGARREQIFEALHDRQAQVSTYEWFKNDYRAFSYRYSI